VEDSFSRGLLDFPQFTRPAEIVLRGASAGARRPVESGGARDVDSAEDVGSAKAVDAAKDARSAKASAERAERVLKVPDVLLSGNHAEIRRWRKREALSRTLDRRPDLLDGATLDEEEVEMLRELKGAKHGRD
jgi:tRNA G37 N-methylase TrmD